MPKEDKRYEAISRILGDVQLARARTHIKHMHQVPYYISQKTASFRISMVMFICDKLGIDAFGEVIPVSGLKRVLYVPRRDRCVTDIGYCVAPLLHYMPCFQVGVFAFGDVVQFDAPCLKTMVDHDMDYLCTSEPPIFDHERRFPLAVCDSHISVYGGPTNRRAKSLREVQDQ